jgi:hypothetical protein
MLVRRCPECGETGDAQRSLDVVPESMVPDWVLDQAAAHAEFG